MARRPDAARNTDTDSAYDLVIRRAHVFDGHRAHDGLRDVGVNGGEIAAIASTPLRGATEVQAAGAWLLPGLIDTHVHVYDVHAVSDPASMREFEQDALPRLMDLFLQHGVTTVKSVGDPTGEILGTRAEIATGALRGPRLLVTGCGITGRDGHPASTVFSGNPWARARFAAEVDNVQQLRDLVHRLADRNVDAIKLLSEGACPKPGAPRYVWQNPAFAADVELVRLPVELLRAGIDTAHARHLRVTVHTTQQDAAREAIRAGADGLEHGVTVEPITDHTLIDSMLEGDVVYTPTLWADHGSHPDARGNLAMVADAGVTVALGSDTFCGPGLFGGNTLEEAELMVAAGMTPTQSLVAGTSAAARQCARPDIGEVAPGKRADLILLGADPTADIRNIRELSMTIVDGKIVAPGETG